MATRKKIAAKAAKGTSAKVHQGRHPRLHQGAGQQPAGVRHPRQRRSARAGVDAAQPRRQGCRGRRRLRQVQRHGPPRAPRRAVAGLRVPGLPGHRRLHQRHRADGDGWTARLRGWLRCSDALGRSKEAPLPRGERCSPTPATGLSAAVPASAGDDEVRFNAVAGDDETRANAVLAAKAGTQRLPLSLSLGEDARGAHKGRCGLRVGLTRSYLVSCRPVADINEKTLLPLWMTVPDRSGRPQEVPVAREDGMQRVDHVLMSARSDGVSGGQNMFAVQGRWAIRHICARTWTSAPRLRRRCTSRSVKLRSAPSASCRKHSRAWRRKNHCSVASSSRARSSQAVPDRSVSARIGQQRRWRAAAATVPVACRGA